MILNLTLFSRPNCHLCEQAEADLLSLQETNPHKLTVIDIDSDEALKRALALEIPVAEVGPFRLTAPFSRQDLQVTLGAAADRMAQLDKINDPEYRSKVERGASISKADRISFWMSKHYLTIMIVWLLLYFGLPFMAPLFKEVGWNLPAEVIYKLYRPVCHQWSFRSWFLFGEQAYYPHEEAGIAGVLTFEEASGISDTSDPGRIEAREFEGNDRMGYKVALCQRDEAIWGSMFLFGIVYAVTGRKIKKIHWLIWILVGIAPIGLDGFSQLISQFPSEFIHSLLPYRESSPLLRTITGTLFGLTTAWFTLPLMEETMSESRRELAKKFAILKS